MVEALKMIREGRWTIRRAAKFAAVTYYEILDKMADEGITRAQILRIWERPFMFDGSSRKGR